MHSLIQYNNIKNYFDENSITYTVDEESNSICILTNDLDCSLESAFIFIEARERDFLFHATYNNLKISPSCSANIRELLSRINSDHFQPTFIFDHYDDIILCRLCKRHDGENLDIESFMGSMLRITNHLGMYGNAILSVALGLQTPEAAINSVQSNG